MSQSMSPAGRLTQHLSREGARPSAPPTTTIPRTLTSLTKGTWRTSSGSPSSLRRGSPSRVARSSLTRRQRWRRGRVRRGLRKEEGGSGGRGSGGHPREISSRTRVGERAARRRRPPRSGRSREDGRRNRAGRTRRSPGPRSRGRACTRRPGPPSRTAREPLGGDERGTGTTTKTSKLKSSQDESRPRQNPTRG